MSQGYCLHRDELEHGSTGVPRIDIFEDSARGDLFFSVSSLLSLCLLLVIEFFNRIKFRQSGGQYKSFLILPSYFGYLTAMLFSSLAFVFMYILHEQFDEWLGRWGHVLPISIHFGVVHFFFESPTFFLMASGASKTDVKTAMRYGLGSAVLAFWVLFVAAYYRIFEHNFTTPFVIFIIHQIFMDACYATIVIFPNLVVSRRPALIPYAICMLVYNVTWTVLSIALYIEGNDAAYCAVYVTSFIVDGFYPPLVMYFAFVIDSQYWQGLLELEHNVNPVAGMWEVDQEVVSTMSMSIRQPSAVTKNLVPVIHFGMIQVDLSGFKAGGFSRVYAAKYKNVTVALKLLFAMELNKESIIKFYQEAQLLQDLQHKNVVTCVGVTVMPPAIGLIMEYCAYGSLFDFLYERSVAAPRGRLRTSSKATIDTSVHRKSSLRPSMSRESRSSVLSSDGCGRKAMSRNEENMESQDYLMMLDATRAVEHIHARGFMHCDIKSLNYLVTGELRLKLSDFGESRSINTPRLGEKPPRVAAIWCAPELLESGATSESYTPKADVFSLSMVLSEIMLKKLPLEDVNRDFNYSSWYDALASGARPIIPEATPDIIASILSRAWRFQPADRPTAAEIGLVIEEIVNVMDNDFRDDDSDNVVFNPSFRATTGAHSAVSEPSKRTVNISIDDGGYELRGSVV